MSLRIYNSLTRTKENFIPRNFPEVKMYVCGPTVYNFLHVGNFRNPVFFNLVRNWLEHLGYKVRFAVNFTDIDDRIIEKAHQEGVDSEVISERYIAEFKSDFSALGLRPHDANPKVTEHLNAITELIQNLIAKNRAYVANGDVNYSIKEFPNYGKLSGRNVEELVAGARVEVNEHKQNPLDFALWKATKPGEPHWNSPWGEGRPGWHIECSAMVKSIFGDQIDIHGGGTDLIFPHHENEIAQSEGCTEKVYSKFWMHVNMLNVSGMKMSKSLGNFITLRDFLKDNHPEVYKWMILSVHYRSVSDFGPEGVDRAIVSLARIYSAMAVAESYLSNENLEKWQKLPPVGPWNKEYDQCWRHIEEALNDDFNTPECWAALFEFIRLFNSQVRRGMKDSEELQSKCYWFLNILRRLGALMSLFQEPPAIFLKTMDDRLLAQKNLKREDIDRLVEQRWSIRKAGDYQKADELRAQLTEMGIAVMDTSEGPFWEVQKKSS